MTYNNPQLQKISELQTLLIKARGIASDLADDEEIADMRTVALRKQIKDASRLLEQIGVSHLDRIENDDEYLSGIIARVDAFDQCAELPARVAIPRTE